MGVPKGKGKSGAKVSCHAAWKAAVKSAERGDYKPPDWETFRKEWNSKRRKQKGK